MRVSAVPQGGIQRSASPCWTYTELSQPANIKQASRTQASPALKMRTQRSGDVMIGFQPLGAMPDFSRLVVVPKTQL